MTDDDRLPDPLPLLPQLPTGATIIVRGRDSNSALAVARRIAGSCRRRGVQLFVSLQRPPAPMFVDGVHIPESCLGHWQRHRLRAGNRRQVSTSAHSLRAVGRAGRMGVDFVLLSPVFKTSSHADRAALGLGRFAACQRLAQRPIVGLGGVSMRRWRQVLACGAVGIAGIGLFAESRGIR